jgi:hypothetical protein
MLALSKIPPHFEVVIERFEAASRAGRAPPIEQVLGKAHESDPVAQARLTWELVAIDLEYRWQSPHRRGPLLELYVKRLGAWATLDDLPAELIAEEYRVRQRFGDRPSHAEYAARFPRHGRALLEALAHVDLELSREYPLHKRARGETCGTPAAAGESASLLDYRDFAIRRLIAAGGMSRVYTAVQKSTQSPVALKVLNKSLARQPHSVRRFEREARIAAALAQNGVIGALGLGRFPDGGIFMAMRLIDGPDLTRLPEGVPLPPVRAVELVRRIATIVARMHERQWLHCDLKPSNVLVDSRGAPWLTDLAMAQPLAPTARAGDAEHHFALGGTPAFMAPEQFAGDAALLSPASDIFALGGVLFYLLTGRAPRDEQHWSPSTAAPVQWNLLESVDAPFRKVVQRCLTYNPRNRYPSCSELVRDLDGQ